MITALTIVGTMGLAISTVLFSVNQKISSIWVLFASLVLFSAALCFHLQGLVHVPKETEFKGSTLAELKNPVFSESLSKVTVTIGSNSIIQDSEGLKHRQSAPFNIGGFLPIKMYVEGNTLYADVEIYQGPHLPSVILKKNTLSNRPPNWDFNSNDKAMEVVNENGVPAFQLYYKTPTHIVINGIFPCPNALIVATESGTTFNPILPMKVNLPPLFKYPSWKHPGELR